MFCLGCKSLGHTREDPLTYMIYWTVREWKCWACEYSQWCIGKIIQCSEEFFFTFLSRGQSAETPCCSSLCSPSCRCVLWLPAAHASRYDLWSPGNTGFLAGSLAADHLLLPPAPSLLLQASQSICHTPLFTPILIWSSLPQPWGQPAWWHHKCPAQKWRH